MSTSSGLTPSDGVFLQLRITARAKLRVLFMCRVIFCLHSIFDDLVKQWRGQAPLPDLRVAEGDLFIRLPSTPFSVGVMLFTLNVTGFRPGVVPETGAQDRDAVADRAFAGVEDNYCTGAGVPA
jgi:hypothetical protein